ncbi:MAG: efflux RND transporter periplasmic adaptor subunit [Bacteroidetes bacterium]|nr:efflux RND transporter periplasmic adaptor subunit [Bacteroidota bacterium]HET6242937.1 efflux RND transporter periplasmic adaptor subunit [Bacteroidia bacterium]
MKRIIVVALATVFIASCGQPEEVDKELGNLLHQRDSMQELISKVSQQLNEVKKQINLKDTTIQIKSVLVSTVVLKPEKFEHYLEVHGIVETRKNITLNAEINSVIRTIKVFEGEKVTKGQVLVVLDQEIIQKNINEVETAFEYANTVFQRQEKLWKQNIGSEMQYLEAKNRKESMEQKLKTLKSQREMTIVKAPFSGIVDEIFPKEGEMASPMAPLIRLMNLDEMYITADLPENYLKTIKEGNQVMIKFPSLDIEMASKIGRVGQFINPANRTFKVQINLDKSNEVLKPNLLAIMLIKTFEKDSAAVVSSAAIQYDAKGKEFVFVVQKDGLGYFAKRSDIKSGQSYNNKTFIFEGLSGNEQIIIEGARGLKENDKINVSQ